MATRTLESARRFQSTPSTRRVTEWADKHRRLSPISIHTLHTEGDPRQAAAGGHHRISIHTLHTEGDSKYKQLYHICTSINCTIYPII